MPTLTPTHDLPTITEGDDVDIPVEFVKPNGDPVDITDWTVSLSIAEQTYASQGSGFSIQKDIVTHSDPTAGKTGFHLDSSDTAGKTGTARYDIQITRPNGVVSTVVIGSVAFIDGVTDRNQGTGTGTAGSFTADGIAVTLAGGEVSVSVSVGGAFSAADAVAAMDGATITPAKVGTQADPVTQTYTDELSVGNGTQPPFPHTENLLEKESSNSVGYFVGISEEFGLYPPVNDMVRGDMSPHIRLISEMKTSDSSFRVDTQLFIQSYDKAGTPYSSAGVSTNSKTFEPVDTGWVDLSTEPIPYDKPFFVVLAANSEDSSNVVTVRRATMMIGLK